ncbi:hypothetical protein [Bradyrhizobium elkanii]|uniref:hypothetical protein n=1 Tax=Bradyrhizobium elkanii TaxID=29448 RepID=UPI0012FE55E1|nr:hypothetical protein [Bradyrhizobium elkanii]
MTNPNWFSWYSFPIFAPLSGAVTQDIDNVLTLSKDEKEAFKDTSLGEQLRDLSDLIVKLAAFVGADLYNGDVPKEAMPAFIETPVAAAFGVNRPEEQQEAKVRFNDALKRVEAIKQLHSKRRPL